MWLAGENRVSPSRKQRKLDSIELQVLTPHHCTYRDLFGDRSYQAKPWRLLYEQASKDIRPATWDQLSSFGTTEVCSDIPSRLRPGFR